MTFNKELIIFDIDGVLFNSKNLVLESVYRTIRDFEGELRDRILRLPDREKILSGVGFSNEQFIDNLGLELSGEERDYFRDRLISNEIELMEKGELFGGVKKILDDLKGKIKLAIGSGCKREYLISFLENFDLEYYFDISICSDDVIGGEKKYIIQTIIEHQEVLPSETLYVGDTYSDYIASLNTGIDFVGVLWGYGVREDFPKEVDLISSPEELRNFLLKIVDVKGQ